MQDLGRQASHHKIDPNRCRRLDAHEQFHEDVYVSIRAKATPERTCEVVLDGMAKVAAAFAEHGLVVNVRLETYAGNDYFHLPPKQ